MPHPLIRSRLIGRIRHAIAEAEQASLIEHDGMAGDIRELLVDSLLKPLLRPAYAVGSGKVADARGTLSAQTDLIIHAPALIPPLLYSESGPGVFPVEGVLATIEVKTKLSATEIKTAIPGAYKLRHDLWPSFFEGDEKLIEIKTKKPSASATRLPVRILFAFGTDQVKEDELSRYRKYDQDCDSDPAFNMICVAGAGLWIFNATEKRWHSLYESGTPDCDEVIDFLCALDAVLSSILATRQQQVLAFYVSQHINAK